MEQQNKNRIPHWLFPRSLPYQNMDKNMDKIWNGREHYSKQIDTKRKSYKWLKYILVRSLNTTIVNVFLLNVFAHILTHTNTMYRYRFI